MAIFTVSRRNRIYRRGGAVNRLPQVLALGAAFAVSFAVTPAGAQTIGNSGDANSVAAIVGGLTDGTGNAIDLSTALVGFIQNPYIQVVSGISGSFSANSVTYNIPGMISINNIDGSRRFTSDNNKPLAGDRDRITSRMASQFEVTNQGFVNYNFPTYLRAIVDETTITPLVTPASNRFDPNTLNLIGIAPLSNNVVIQQEVRLFRATAQFRWLIKNNDTTAHTVRLRYAVNGSDPFFYQDPERGISQTPRVYTGALIPDIFYLYGNRYETEATQNGPYAAKFIFRKTGNAGAPTLPSKLLVADNVELRPNDARFDVTSTRNIESLAVGVYYGPYSLPPGGTAEVIAYFGNGSVTETVDRDYVVAADGPESLGYNTAAATATGIKENPGVDILTAAPQFLSPNPFVIYGGIYNRVANTPSTSIALNNVRASLTLPKGLAFTSGSSSSPVDTADKTLTSVDGGTGQVVADRGADASWNVRATGDVYGTVTYQVNIRTNEAGSRQISRTLNIPATPFRQLPTQNFQMLGFPFDFDPTLSNNSDPYTVINGLTRPIDDAYVFKTWIPDPNSTTGAGRYADVNRLENGVGYFFKPGTTRSFIFAKGVKPLARQAEVTGTNFASTNVKQIQLRRGWNLISNPYVYEIPLRYLRFATSGDITNAISFQQASDSGLLLTGLYYLNPDRNSYDYFFRPESGIKPWEAYWILLSRDVTLVYQLPALRNSVVLPNATGEEPATRSVRGEIASGRAVNAAQTGQDWRLQLVAAQAGGKSDQAAIIGVSPTSKDGDNSLTSPKPPTPYSDYVYTTLIKDGVAPLAKDIRRSANTDQTWTWDVTADSEGKVMLSWPGAARLPRQVKLMMKDTATGRTYSMRSQSSVTISIGKGQTSRFVVTAKQQATTPLSISGLRMVAPSGRSSGRSFIFNVSREASVTAKVTTLSGKVIATLATGRAVSAGENRLNWTSRAETGAALAPGPYLVEIVAQDGDGEVAPARQPFVIIE